jgi:hypothetical protein
MHDHARSGPTQCLACGHHHALQANKRGRAAVKQEGGSHAAGAGPAAAAAHHRPPVVVDLARDPVAPLVVNNREVQRDELAVCDLTAADDDDDDDDGRPNWSIKRKVATVAL